MAVEIAQKQVNIRIDSGLYRALESIARRERRSVAQTARVLLEEGLRRQACRHKTEEAPTSGEIAELVMAGGSFDWLWNEPDLYDENSGEPID